MEKIAITGITAVPFSIPLREHVKVAIAEFESRDHVLVSVQTDAGVTGIGEAVPRWMSYGETQASVVEVINSRIEPTLIGTDVFARKLIGHRLRHLVGNHSAKAAVDIALWDIAGKVLAQPLWRLLGGTSDPVRAATLIPFAEPSRCASQASIWRERYGITAFKIKVGREATMDAAVCSAIRRALGTDATLYADANQGYLAHEAWRFLQLAEEVDLAWLEDPVPSGDQLGRRWLATKTGIPLAADSNCRDLQEARTAVLDDECRVVSVKLARTGFTESQKILALCEALHVVPTVGSQGDTGLGATAGLHLAAAQSTLTKTPSEIVPHLGLVQDLLHEGPALIDGFLVPPDLPGLGVEVDSSQLAKYRTD